MYIRFKNHDGISYITMVQNAYYIMENTPHMPCALDVPCFVFEVISTEGMVLPVVLVGITEADSEKIYAQIMGDRSMDLTGISQHILTDPSESEIWNTYIDQNMITREELEKALTKGEKE